VAKITATDITGFWRVESSSTCCEGVSESGIGEPP
jgi:hypothetical protein